jgi:hypothetical protein
MKRDQFWFVQYFKSKIEDIHYCPFCGEKLNEYMYRKEKEKEMNIQKKDICLSRNGVICFSKSFVCRSIIELMESLSKRQFTPTKSNTTNMSLKRPDYFIPNDLYKKLADIFEAFYNKRPDKNVFYICVRMLENQKKLEKIKIKRQVYYKLV